MGLSVLASCPKECHRSLPVRAPWVDPEEQLTGVNTMDQRGAEDERREAEV